jgi:hypothetical protein
LNSATEFEQKIESKNNSRKLSLVDQGRHLAIEVKTSETTHARMERERIRLQNNIKTKPEQIKFSKTYPSI